VYLTDADRSQLADQWKSTFSESSALAKKPFVLAHTKEVSSKELEEFQDSVIVQEFKMEILMAPCSITPLDDFVHKFSEAYKNLETVEMLHKLKIKEKRSSYVPIPLDFGPDPMKGVASLTRIAKLPTPSFTVESSSSKPASYKLSKSVLDCIPSKKWHLGSTDISKGRIKSYRLLTQKQALKRVYEIELDVSDIKDWDWKPCDAFGVVPPNSESIVEYLLERLKLERDWVYNVSSAKTDGESL
jgi:sulfite reductase alpha subunit-like flavoprotein